MSCHGRPRPGGAEQPVAGGVEEPSRSEDSLLAGKASAGPAKGGCEGWTCVREASLGDIPPESCLELPGES